MDYFTELDKMRDSVLDWASQHVTLLLLYVFLAYQAWMVLYRLYFHPLARFPGPKLAAATFLYEFFYDVFAKEGGDFVNHVERLHDIYGPVLRVTPDEIHVRDTTWSHVLYAGPSHIRHKDPSLANVAGTGDGSFGTADHVLHRRRRGPVSTYFSRGAVMRMQDRIWARANRMCEVLEQHRVDSSVVVGRALFLGWSNDTLRSCAFGQDLQLIGNPDKAMGFDTVFKAFATFYPILKQAYWIIPVALRMPTAPFWYIYRPLAVLLTVHTEMINMAEKCRKEHFESTKGDTLPQSAASPLHKNAYPGLYHALLQSHMPESEKEARRMAHEGFEILLAGSDTTARTMGILIYHVLANPDAARRLSAEVREAFAQGGEKTDLTSLEQLPYLTACVKEALRIGKVTDHRLSLIAPDEDLVYEQWTIPKGSRVSMTPTRNSYDEQFFPNPEDFIPDRWLQPAEVIKRMETYFMPFAHGRRGCLGWNFAMAELRIGTAQIFRQFEMELFDTVRERDIDHSWAHIAGEPCRSGKGLRFHVKGRLD